MNKKGFTLIELLVVIAIIGILSTLAVVSLNGARDKANDAKVKSDLGQIRSLITLNYDTGDFSTLTNSSTLWNKAQVATFTTPTCVKPVGYVVGGTSTAWAAYADLCGETGWYCLDSTGFAGVITTTTIPAGNSKKCQ